jgi:transposase-like protein
MSTIQSIVKALVSRDAYASMERESRSWMVQCPNCNSERSIWDMGGIRWGASGKPRTHQLCFNCNQPGWHVIYKKS